MRDDRTYIQEVIVIHNPLLSLYSSPNTSQVRTHRSYLYCGYFASRPSNSFFFVSGSSRASFNPGRRKLVWLEIWQVNLTKVSVLVEGVSSASKHFRLGKKKNIEKRTKKRKQNRGKHKVSILGWVQNVSVVQYTLIP